MSRLIHIVNYLHVKGTKEANKLKPAPYPLLVKLGRVGYTHCLNEAMELALLTR
jgi:hypothetical protein